MIPLRDTIQSKSYPVVNSSIIAANVIVYFIQMSVGQDFTKFIYTYGLVPARYSLPEFAAHFSLSEQVFSFLSFMFLHGGFWHLLGNMWSLYIFGDNVEDRLGPVRYLLFYLLCGFASGLTHLFTNWHSQIPTVGASGAIAGVMGAYFLLYPKSRILTFIPIFFLPYFIEVPAFIFLGVWFLFQFLSATSAPVHGGGIAWWAHIGGFLFGVVFLKLFLKMPELGMTERVRSKISKKKTHRLQVIKTADSTEKGDLYSSLVITPLEAKLGTKKLVRIPWGLQKRLVRVTVPPDSKEGVLLRLSGLGRPIDGDKRGDFYIRIMIR